MQNISITNFWQKQQRDRESGVGGVEVVAHCVHRQDIAGLRRGLVRGADEGLRVWGDSSEILSGYAAVNAFLGSCPPLFQMKDGWDGWPLTVLCYCRDSSPSSTLLFWDSENLKSDNFLSYTVFNQTIWFVSSNNGENTNLDEATNCGNLNEVKKLPIEVKILPI